MPSIKKRGNSYRIMVSLGYGMDGRQIRKHTTFTPPEDVTDGKALKLATAYAYEFEKECRGISHWNENIRFKELYDWYFEQIAPNKLKENTLNNNKLILRCYVLPYIGNLKLKDITTARIDQLFHHLHEHGATRERYILKDESVIAIGTRRPLHRKCGVSLDTMKRLSKGKAVLKETAQKLSDATGRTLKDCFSKVVEEARLDSGTIARVRTALSPIFSTAVKKDMLAKNPVFNATTPKDAPEETPYLNAEDCKTILQNIDDFLNPQMPRVIKTLLYTGMRSGELMALHWQDVDFDSGMITIRYTLYRSNREYKLSSPKTKSSNRVIAMPPQLIESLKEQKEWQEKQKANVGDRWVERGAVFTGTFGEYMNQTYVNSEFKKFLKRHNLPHVHIHDLRHANASLLINMGLPVKMISEHLGHSDTRTTENIYAHVFNESRRITSDAISQALENITE